MKAPPFAYLRPSSVEEVEDALARHGEEAMPLAGGQSLLAMMNLRLAAPAVLVDLNRVEALAGVREVDGGLVLGALTRHAELVASPLVARLAPVLAEAARHVAHPAVRHRGTLGGSLALADPAAELPACCVALDARIVLRSAGGEREVAARDFFLGLYETARRPDELLVAVRVPAMEPGRSFHFLEIARRHGDFALAGLVASARREGNAIVAPRLVYFAIGDRPQEMSAAAAALEGTPREGDALERARAALDATVVLSDSPQTPAAYRRRLARVLLERATSNLTSEQEDADVRD